MDDTDGIDVDSPGGTGITRQTLVHGAVWAPLLLTGSPAAHAAVGRRVAGGALHLGPRRVTLLDAVCLSSAQCPGPNVPRLRVGYGRVWLPSTLRITNRTPVPAWYRYRATATPSGLQIEVAGRHGDENGTGHRAAFILGPVGTTGDHRSLPITYRTSATRPYFGGPGVPGASRGCEEVTMTIDLQRCPSTSTTEPVSGWATIESLTCTGRVWRTARVSPTSLEDPIDFGSSLSQSPARVTVGDVERPGQGVGPD